MRSATSRTWPTEPAAPVSSGGFTDCAGRTVRLARDAAAPPAPVKKAAVKKAAKATKKAKGPGKKRTPNAAFMKAMTPSASLAAIIGDRPVRIISDLEFKSPHPRQRGAVDYDTMEKALVACIRDGLV